MNNYAKPIEVQCPKCKQEPYQPCVAAEGEPMGSYHDERREVLLDD